MCKRKKSSDQKLHVIASDQKVHVIGVVVITKNQDNSIVLPSGEGAIIAVSLGIFLGLVEAGEVSFNGGKLTL